MARVAKDERINAFFINTDLPKLREHLIAFVCVATGGPCKYTGRDMRTAHVGMMINEAEFNALVEDLKGALDHFKVPDPEQQELLGALGPLKGEIVQPPSGPPPADTPVVRNLVGERVRALRDSANLLEKADSARSRGNRSFGEQLFSAAELLINADSMNKLATAFREGGPPRVNTPLKSVPADSPPQPPVVGNSAEDEPDRPLKKGASLKGAISLTGGSPLQGFAIVTLEPTSGTFKRRQPKRRFIEQRGREFAPKVLAVPVGSTVSFPNFDPIYHNVFSRSATRSFDLGIYRSGLTRELAFEKPGIVRIGCNLHANMFAYVVVVSAPHYAVTDKEGNFNFASLSPGKYRLQAWSEGSDVPKVQSIQIKPNTNTIALTLSSDEHKKALEDKFGSPRDGAPSP
jgi:truncated hemoglobin YjbI/plastocyanin